MGAANQRPAATAARSPLVQLQQSIGNRAVGRLVQAKLRVGAPNDRFEQEADRVADQVMRTPAPEVSAAAAAPQISRKCAQCEEEETIQRKPAQTSSVRASAAHGGVQDVLGSSGRPLDPVTRVWFESRFGHDLGGVRVHTDARAAESASAVGALAYTVGQDVVFGSRQYAPGTEAGRRLLAHELVHTIQQGGQPRALQRRCDHTECPGDAIYLPAQWPLWRWAEACIQNIYANEHPEAKRGVSLSFNEEWQYIRGGTTAQRQALACLRNQAIPEGGPHFTARGGLRAGEPDIWDFHNRTIYEITTSFGTAERIARVQNEVDEANQICAPMECGGLSFRIGTWEPRGACYTLRGPLKMEVFRNVAGVIVYAIAISARHLAELATVVGTVWIARYAPTIARTLAKAALGGGELALEGAAANTALRGSLASTSATTSGGTAASAGAATEAATAAEVAGGEAIVGGGAGAVLAGALPVITMVGVFIALGAPYAQARAEARNESTASGFSQGFVMGILNWEWQQVVSRFGVFGAAPTPSDEAIGVIKANAYNRGLKAGYQTGADLADADKRAYVRALRRLAGTRVPQNWTRREQIDYVIELAAAARVHFLRPE